MKIEYADVMYRQTAVERVKRAGLSHLFCPLGITLNDDERLVKIYVRITTAMVEEEIQKGKTT